MIIVTNLRVINNNNNNQLTVIHLADQQVLLVKEILRKRIQVGIPAFLNKKIKKIIKKLCKILIKIK